MQFSTVAVIDDAAALVERITYDAYGAARHHYMADWDGNGRVTQAEIDQINTVAGGANHAIGETDYNPDMDIDRDGDVKTADYTIANNEGTHSALATGLISDPSVDNQIGYDSYVFNAETLQYLARNRWYDPIHGRWIERDPLGYVDGMNLYEYTESSPTVGSDPSGSWTARIHKNATTRWAQDAGFPEKAAKFIGRTTDDVDRIWLGKSWMPILGNQSYHFNMNRHGPLDSRIQVFDHHMFEAAEACNCSKGRDRPEKAAQEIGYALHPLQDYVAHGDYGTKANGGIWWVHNSISRQDKPGNSSSWPDDENLDAFDKNWKNPDLFRRALDNGVMIWEVHGIFGDQIRGWAYYKPGRERIRFTERLTGGAFDEFKGDLRLVSRPGTRCWEYFGMPD